MEKDRKGRIIAIVALVIAVAGLSIGFAAFSTSLQIGTSANVKASSNWNVGFSTDGTNIEDVSTAGTVSANETGNPGELDVTKYTIGQKTNATLSTTEGSSVSYNLSILNKGSLTAYLDSVNFDNVSISCTNAPAGTNEVIEGTAAAGTTEGANSSTISNEDCAKMFGVTLSINGTNYTSTASNPTGSIAALSNGTPGSVPVVLTVAYKGTSDANEVAATLDGNIVVTIGTISVVYTSNGS